MKRISADRTVALRLCGEKVILLDPQLRLDLRALLCAACASRLGLGRLPTREALRWEAWAKSESLERRGTAREGERERDTLMAVAQWMSYTRLKAFGGL